MKKIVVVGSSNIDLIMKMERLPERGETVSGSEFFKVFGGKGANQAVAAARAGGNVVFVSCVGDDENVPQMIRNYSDNGIDTSFIFREKEIASGHALIMIGANGENCISVAPGANSMLSAGKIQQAFSMIEGAEMILVQYEIPEETLKYVIDIAASKNIPLVCNFAPAQDFDFSYLSKISTLIVNETEAGFLSKMQIRTESDVEMAARILTEKGVSRIIITLGEKGVYAFDKAKKFYVPAFQVDAVDTTAAGDTFCGSFLVALVEGQEMQAALRFASAASAIAVTSIGAQPSIPTREEIEQFLKEH
ncbi:ribokinase [uncultured Draconibacterium sp.]|uniref:ribokinase n=1 Tax=uncultured Draconibacterium sp. TaxID=1573823 RepID=UPI0032167D24